MTLRGRLRRMAEDGHPRSDFVTYEVYCKWRNRMGFAFVVVVAAFVVGLYFIQHESDQRARAFCSVRVIGERAAVQQIAREREALGKTRLQLRRTRKYLRELPPEERNSHLTQAVRKGIPNQLEDIVKAQDDLNGARVFAKASAVPDTCYTQGYVERPKR